MATETSEEQFLQVLMFLNCFISVWAVKSSSEEQLHVFWKGTVRRFEDLIDTFPTEAIIKHDKLQQQDKPSTQTAAAWAGVRSRE